MTENENLRPEKSAEDAPHDTDTIAVMAEQLDVKVSEEVTGRVRITTRNESVEYDVEENLSTVTARVTRVPINREIGPDEQLPKTRVEKGVQIVPVLEERLVIEKRLVLIEEIRIESRTETESVKVPVMLRRQNVDVQRVPSESTDSE